MFYEFWMLNRRLVPVGKTSEITLKARYEQRRISELRRQGTLKLQCVSAEGLLENGEIAPWDGWDNIPYTLDSADADLIRWEVTPAFEGELCYRLVVESAARTEVVAEWGLYALDADLYPLLPLRGDLHIHTSCSECGRRNEDPKYVAAWARKRGLDFIAITDHAQRDPSRLTAEWFRTTGCPMQVYPGEETHMLFEKVPTLFCRNRFIPTNHIVSFGATAGVVAWANEHFQEYWDTLEKMAAALPAKFPHSVRLAMAGSDWLIDKIHEFGGLAIFCHPFWRPRRRMNLAAPVRDYILEQNKFDAMEVIGLGTYMERQYPEMEGNRRAVAWWQQMSLRRGSAIPLVGTTDSHATRELIGRQYTTVFAAENTLESVQAAIRAGRSLACLRHEEQPLSIFGDYRLVSYAYYLEREYFPEHDARCAAEGEQLLNTLEPPSPLK